MNIRSLGVLLSTVGLIWLMVVPVQATEVYVTRDAEGNLIYSDKPMGESTRHQVQALPTVPAFTAPVSSPVNSRIDSERRQRQSQYTSLSIISPSDQFTLETGLAGDIEVSAVLSPGLRFGHSLVLLVNDQVVQRSEQSQFSLRNLSRGEQVLQIQVRDESERILISSQTVKVHVKRAIAPRIQPRKVN